MTDLTRRGRGRGRKGRTDDVDRIRSEEDKRRKGGGETRCGWIVLANQKRKHRGAKSKKFLFFVSLSGVLVINVVIFIQPLRTPLCVSTPRFHLAIPAVRKVVFGRTWEIRQILRMYGSGVGAAPSPLQRLVSFAVSERRRHDARMCSLIEFIQMRRRKIEMQKRVPWSQTGSALNNSS